MWDATKSHPNWDRRAGATAHREASPVLAGPPEAVEPSSPRFAAPDRSRGFRELIRSADFAATVGIVAPIVCLLLDPLVLKGGDEHGPILGRYWVFAYSFIGLEAAMLSAWLARRGRLGPLCGIAAGVLLGGAIFAAGLGLLLLPLSLVGVLVLIGVMGFTPLLTACAYLLQGWLALRAARARDGWAGAVTGISFGVVLAFGLPAGAQVGVHRMWREALRAVSDGDPAARSRVEFWYRFVDQGGQDDTLDRAIEGETDPVRKERLARVRE